MGIDKINDILKNSKNGENKTKIKPANPSTAFSRCAILIVVVVSLLGLTVSLFDVFRDQKTGACELLDVGHVVVLSHVDAEGRAC